MLRIASLTFTFVALSCLPVLATNTLIDGPKGQDKVELTGKLLHPVFAIGGETTGTVIETKKGTYELDLGKSKELLKQVEALKGKQVLVRGILKAVKGIEVPERRIVTVSGLKELQKDDRKEDSK